MNFIYFQFQSLLVAIVLLSYYGNDGKRLVFGLLDYLGVGITVGFCIVIPLIFLTYLFEGNILIFVSFHCSSTSCHYEAFVAGVLAVTVGHNIVHERCHHDIQLLLSSSIRCTCWQGAGLSLWKCLHIVSLQYNPLCHDTQKVNHESFGCCHLDVKFVSQLCCCPNFNISTFEN